MKRLLLPLCLSVVLLVGIGCTQADSEPVATDTAATGSPCGDGVCDAAEQKDATLCPGDCGSSAAAKPESASDEDVEGDFAFVVDEGIRLEGASNAGARIGSDGSLSLVFQNRSGAPGRNDVAVATKASDWLDFTVTETGANPDEFRALRLPDGTCRAYGLDATKSGILPGASGMKSKSSSDCETFTEDEGVRYELTDSDNGSMGVYDLFVDAKGGVVLLYLGDLMGLNNLRRAYSTDNGWTFTWQADDVLGDASAGGGSQSYVDNKVLKLADGRILMVAMKSGSVYTFLSSDEGVTWTLQGNALKPADFAGESLTGLFDPQIVQLPDGRYRIYVTGQVGSKEITADATQNLYSATTK